VDWHVADTAPALVASALYHIYRERQVETVALRGAEIMLEPDSWTSVTGPHNRQEHADQHSGWVTEPSGGSVLIDGEDLTHLPAAEPAARRHQRIGVVMQRDNLHPLWDGRPAPVVRARTGELLGQVGRV
jgi:hypothetical protein